jgi:RimJ/RimL family protein N-acetyltransferase
MNLSPENTSASQGLTLPFRFQLKDGRVCLLRSFVEADAEELCQLIPRLDGETDFLTRFPGEFDKTVEQERAFIREYTETPGSIGLVGEVDGLIAAVGGVSPQKLKRYQHHREFGLAILKAHWRQGIGRMMTAFIIDWAKRSGLRKLTLKVVHNNHGAIALYKSFGFVEAGRLIDDVLLADGSYGHAILMAKFLQETGIPVATERLG